MAQNRLAACFKGSTAIIFLLLFQGLKAQYDFSSLDAKLQLYQNKLGGNVVALVCKGDKIVYSKELGVDFKANTPVPIGSCSMWITAALVMTFVDEGKLSLDDKVSDYLPIFEQYSKRYITIRQCLSHLTGIAGEGVGKDLWNGTLEDEVNGFASKRDIKAQPGVEFRYSNVGPNIAGRILEIVGKRSFDQLAQQRLLKPLGMKGTSFGSDFRAVDPSGGAVSTAADYMNFLVMLLNKGMFKGKRILSEDAVNQMEAVQTTPQIIKYAPKAVEGYGYGFGGWLLEQDASGKGICIANPSLTGTWAVVDNCRGYASILLIKKLPGGEINKDLYMDIKSSIDGALPCGK